MKKSLFALSILALMSFKTQEEPKTVKLELSVEEVNIIFEGLGELPAKKSEGLRAKIYQEAKKQLEAK
jgi:hypothetical protein